MLAARHHTGRHLGFGGGERMAGGSKAAIEL